MIWWNPKTWFKKTEPSPVVGDVIPEAVPEPPNECLIWTQEIGSGVWSIYAISEVELRPENLDIFLIPRYAVFKALVPFEEALLLLEGFTCLRGFRDKDIQDLRANHFLECGRAFLLEHRRDK